MISRSLFLTLTAATIGGALALGISHLPLDPPFKGSAQAQSTPSQEEADAYDRFFKALDLVSGSYVEEVDRVTLIDAAIDGMLADLDPHSAYLTPDDLEALTQGVSGNFGGLGIQIDMYQDLVRVIAPIDGTPAFEAGLRAGDLITELDGDPVFGKSLIEAVNIMRGEIGTEITLRVVRESSGETFDVTIERGTIPEISVYHRIESGNVGYLRITNFSDRTGEELEEAVIDLLTGAQEPLAGFLLDLRSNPGGALAGSIAVADAFLESGEIVSTRTRGGVVGQRYSARPGDITAGLPLVVLIDGGSASASEIVAAALQDQGRAIIMGQVSFGKGSVQEIMRLGQDTGLKLTTARYYSPEGSAIQNVGVIPDIEVLPATIEYLDYEPAYREEDLSNALSSEAEPDEEATSPSDGLEDRPDLNEAVRPEYETTDEDGDGLEEQLIDYPLERAIDLIQALAIAEQLGKS